MLTIKAVDKGFTRIFEANSFSIHCNSVGGPDLSRHWSEITGHCNSGDDFRLDVGDSPERDKTNSPVRVYQQAYIMNEKGRTIESFNYGPM